MNETVSERYRLAKNGPTIRDLGKGSLRTPDRKHAQTDAVHGNLPLKGVKQ